MDLHVKIYKQHYGEIPFDEHGRKYQIHHIDGDHHNNDPANLRAVSIQDHYDIHYAQGDYGACYLIARQMKLPAEELSKIVSKSNLKRSANGTNPFLGGEIQKKTQRRLVAEGKHHFLGGGLQKKLVSDGTHHFLDRDKAKERALKLVAEGRCNFLNKPIITCPHCNKSGDSSNMKRWHFDKCKYKNES
jgi:hypothetical protein